MKWKNTNTRSTI